MERQMPIAVSDRLPTALLTGFPTEIEFPTARKNAGKLLFRPDREIFRPPSDPTAGRGTVPTGPNPRQGLKLAKNQ